MAWVLIWGARGLGPRATLSFWRVLSVRTDIAVLGRVVWHNRAEYLISKIPAKNRGDI
jgi:hypothetical protein